MLRAVIFVLISIFSFGKLFAEDIPIIVISAGKTYQSKGIVGSDVVVVDSKAISESNEFFLGDVLSENLNGMNYFQTGGHGTTSGIQLRGLPKRYSTVYIDGVKVSDPSSPSNDYYFGNLTKSSIDRVEILKGSQSSLYGSSAIGGTINLFTKKGKEGHHNNIEVSTGSNATKNFNISFDGKEENYDYFVGFNKFLTNGISAMWDNDEKDKYYNDGVVANFGYNINDKIRLENYLRYADSYLEYDEVQAGRADGNNTDDEERSYSLRLIRDDGNLKNTLSYNNAYIKRSTIGYDGENKIYWGYRDTFNLIGEYNFNYDTKIGKDVIIEPNVFFGPNVIIKNNVHIKAFSHIEGVKILDNAVVGPFARLRPGTVIGPNSHVGNFVEIKKTHIQKNSKVNHLSYLGDSNIGENVNIGAGVITCNYDGSKKNKTTIEDNVFVGSNVSLVAPIKLSKSSLVGAGSVITQSVKKNALAVERNEQKTFPNYKKNRKK